MFAAHNLLGYLFHDLRVGPFAWHSPTSARLDHLYLNGACAMLLGVPTQLEPKCSLVALLVSDIDEIAIPHHPTIDHLEAFSLQYLFYQLLCRPFAAHRFVGADVFARSRDR